MPNINHIMERIAIHALYRSDEFTLRQAHVLLWAYCRNGIESPPRVRELYKAFRQRVLDALDPLELGPIVAAARLLASDTNSLLLRFGVGDISFVELCDA